MYLAMDSLYVAFLRVKSKEGLKILIHDSDNTSLKTTMNVVYEEAFDIVY
jgi:hypothetical protein